MAPVFVSACAKWAGDRTRKSRNAAGASAGFVAPHTGQPENLGSAVLVRAGQRARRRRRRGALCAFAPSRPRSRTRNRRGRFSMNACTATDFVKCAHLRAGERGAATPAARRARAGWSPRFVLDNVLAPGGAPGAGGGGEKNQSCENVVSHLVRSPRAAREAVATKKTAVPVSNVNG